MVVIWGDYMSGRGLLIGYRGNRWREDVWRGTRWRAGSLYWAGTMLTLRWLRFTRSISGGSGKSVPAPKSSLYWIFFAWGEESKQWAAVSAKLPALLHQHSGCLILVDRQHCKSFSPYCTLRAKWATSKKWGQTKTNGTQYQIAHKLGQNKGKRCKVKHFSRISCVD